MDLTLNVNVEFMLCPTAAMVSIFALVPKWIIWPSYRSTLTLAVFLVAPPLSYTYILVGKTLRLFLGQDKSVENIYKKNKTK